MKSLLIEMRTEERNRDEVKYVVNLKTQLGFSCKLHHSTRQVVTTNEHRYGSEKGRS